MKPTLPKYSLVLPLAWLCFSVLAAADKPHIVLILADDLGYGDVGAYNSESKIATPHIDALAKRGLRFTDAHSGGSWCVPSRYALLTGKFSTRSENLRDREGVVISDDEKTIAHLLRDDAGYRTAMIGKWHQGFHNSDPDDEKRYDYTKPFTGGPVDRGFDSFFGMHVSLDIPPYFYLQDRKPTALPTKPIEARDSEGTDENWNHIQGAFWRKGLIAPDFVHEEVTPRFLDESVKVIENHATDSDGKPLFLYLALPSPHTPWLPTEEFRGKSGAGMYGDFVMQVDALVGKIDTALEKAGMKEDTLFLFSSDNGPVWYEKDIERFGHDSVAGLRGKKATPYEGGHRVPFIAAWPGSIPEDSVSHQLIAFSDLYATLAELTGAAHDSAKHAGDSVSYLAHLQNPTRDPEPRSAIVHDFWNVREGDWKLVVPKHRKENSEEQKFARAELYDLKTDRAEGQNLAAEHPDKTRELFEILENAQAQTESN